MVGVQLSGPQLPRLELFLDTIIIVTKNAMQAKQTSNGPLDRLTLAPRSAEKGPKLGTGNRSRRVRTPGTGTMTALNQPWAEPLARCSFSSTAEEWFGNKPLFITSGPVGGPR